ncbi:MAG: UDP-N-acetylmuramate dehydrogenase [Patescibacteria group bacterium]|nr:UDP-N-acetylmuramate dehydrogenase [Patescibacteria group bacterium]
MDNIKQLKKILGKGLRENVPMREFTTMQVGGAADFVYIANSIDDLVKAVLAAKKTETPFIVLGGGSNVIASDSGFAGLIILNKSSNIAYLPEKSQVMVDSGVSLGSLVMSAAGHSLSGLEALVGIPGTVGGAVYGSAGAYRVELNSFVKSITLLSVDGKIVRYRGDWLACAYRSTRLKRAKKEGKEIPIILCVKLQLAHGKKDEILRKISQYQNMRNEKVPYDKPSSGSIFKNPGRVPASQSLGKENPKMSSAGYLLEQIEAKKMHLNGAAVSKKHANFVINNKNAKASDIRKLIESLRAKVYDEFKIFLEEEVEYIGEWS